MNFAFKLIKAVIVYGLCFYYNAKVLFGLLLLFVTKSHTKFWVVKERPVPPKCLLDKEYGEHKYATVNGIKLHYVEKGDSTKPLMLFIHGFPEFWYSWRHQIKEFSKDYRTVAVDMRGYGDSDKPEGYSPYVLYNMTEDIRALVKELGVKKFTLVAHDWGAVIAWDYVGKYMDTIDKYIMMDGPPSPVWNKAIISDWGQFRSSWYVFFFQAPFIPEFGFRMFDLKQLKSICNNKYSNAFNEEDLEAFKYTFGKPGALTPPLNYYRANANPFMKKQIFKKPTDFAPGLYLLGEKDIFISKNSGPESQKLFKNLEFKIVKGVHHFIQQEDPVLVNNLMREFLVSN